MNILTLTLLQGIMKDGNSLKGDTLKDLKKLNPSIEEIGVVLATIYLNV